MSRELNRNKCLEHLDAITYKSNPRIETLGRYIKSLRKSQSLTKDVNEKMKYEYVINKYLNKHIALLQDAAIRENAKTPNKRISTFTGNFIKRLLVSEHAVSDNRFTLVDVDGLKHFEILDKSVILKSDLVLPCKVKSENQQYRFNTQVIVSKSNVLGYSTKEYEYDYSSNNVNHNVLLTKVGKGITENELLTKNKESVR